MDNLPEKITDIADEKVLIEVLKNMSKYDVTYTVKNGFIYYSDRLSGRRDGYLLLEQIDYMHKQSRDFPCIDKTPKSGDNYLMFNNTFNLIVSKDEIRIIGDQLFCSRPNWAYIVQTSTGYYSLSGFLHDDIEPYTPVKFNYKINILKKIDGEQIIKIDNTHRRHVIDPYKACDSLFMCADTYDIVNVETGERIPTWPLVHISSGINLENLSNIENAVNNIGCICPKIEHVNRVFSACILFDNKWNIHYLIVNQISYELRRTDSGKATKAVAEAE